jgi:hypothetical protein
METASKQSTEPNLVLFGQPLFREINQLDRQKLSSAVNLDSSEVQPSLRDRGWKLPRSKFLPRVPGQLAWARNASTSEEEGSEGCAPARVTEIAAAAAA